MKDDILDVLRKSENPLTEIEIQDKLNVSLDKLCEELRTMEKCGDVYVTKKGKYTVYATDFYGNKRVVKFKIK